MSDPGQEDLVAKTNSTSRGCVTVYSFKRETSTQEATGSLLAVEFSQPLFAGPICTSHRLPLAVVRDRQLAQSTLWASAVRLLPRVGVSMQLSPCWLHRIMRNI